MNTIYDFETMSQDPVNGVVVSFAMLNFDPKRFTSNPYTYNELVDNAKFMKFDVVDQVKNYGRTICKDTVEWWGNQSKEAQKSIAPNPSNGIFTLKNPSLIDGVIVITDGSGRIIYESSLDVSEKSIDISKVSLGIYYLNIKSENNNKVIRLIKN